MNDKYVIWPFKILLQFFLDLWIQFYQCDEFQFKDWTRIYSMQITATNTSISNVKYVSSKNF